MNQVLGATQNLTLFLLILVSHFTPIPQRAR